MSLSIQKCLASFSGKVCTFHTFMIGCYYYKDCIIDFYFQYFVLTEQK